MDPKIKPARVKVIAEIAMSPDGEQLFIDFGMEDGTDVWFAVDHTKVASLAATLVNAAAHASQLRPKVTPGGNPMPARVEVLKPYAFAIGEIEGELVLQVVLDQAGQARVNYRIERSQAASIGQLIAAAGAGSDKAPPVAH